MKGSKRARLTGAGTRASTPEKNDFRGKNPLPENFSFCRKLVYLLAFTSFTPLWRFTEPAKHIDTLPIS